MSRLLRVIQSPALLGCLVLATSGFVGAWYRSRAAVVPPALPGYNWSEHSRALLVAVPPDDCSCGASPAQWAEAGLSRGLDVVVVSSRSDKKLEDLRSVAAGRLHLITNFSPAAAKSLSPNETSRVLHVQDGSIVGTAQGNMAPDEFFRPKEVAL